MASQILVRYAALEDGTDRYIGSCGSVRGMGSLQKGTMHEIIDKHTPDESSMNVDSSLPLPQHVKSREAFEFG